MAGRKETGHTVPSHAVPFQSPLDDRCRDMGRLIEFTFSQSGVGFGLTSWSLIPGGSTFKS